MTQPATRRTKRTKVFDVFHVVLGRFAVFLLFLLEFLFVPVFRLRLGVVVFVRFPVQHLLVLLLWVVVYLVFGHLLEALQQLIFDGAVQLRRLQRFLLTSFLAPVHLFARRRDLGPEHEKWEAMRQGSLTRTQRGPRHLYLAFSFNFRMRISI